jgi:hypothetical protein
MKLGVRLLIIISTFQYFVACEEIHQIESVISNQLDQKENKKKLLAENNSKAEIDGGGCYAEIDAFNYQFCGELNIAPDHQPLCGGCSKYTLQTDQQLLHLGLSEAIDEESLEIGDEICVYGDNGPGLTGAEGHTGFWVEYLMLMN